MRKSLLLIVITLSIRPAQPAECNYQTVAGSAVTFRADGVPVTQARFNHPLAAVSAADGTVYIADTNNNRVRKLSTDGIIRTIAGTGEQAFSGDGKTATTAALNHPAAIALGPDGSLYIADTGNNRIRVVGIDGVIHSIAGDGHARFAGDGGPAIAASLNRPVSIALDADSDVFIADSWNERIRKVGRDGSIRTVAGSQGLDDYAGPPCCDVPDSPAPGTSVSLSNPTVIRYASDGSLYIADALALRRLTKDGQLTTIGHFSKVPAFPHTLDSLPWGIPVPTDDADGSVFLVTNDSVLVIAYGVVYQQPGLPQTFEYVDGSADPTTGGLLTLGDDMVLRRQVRNGRPSSFALSSLVSDPASAASAFDLDLSRVGAIARGPDGTIYMTMPQRLTLPIPIISLKPDGKVSTFVVHNGFINSLAVDSKGSLYVAGPLNGQIFRYTAQGVANGFLSANAGVNAIRFDAQDRLYALQAYPQAPLLRFDQAGAKTSLIADADNSASLVAFNYNALAVAPDGTAWVPTAYYALLKVLPDGGITFIPKEEFRYPSSLAVTTSGKLYVVNRALYELRSDGTLMTVIGGDGHGFWGEHGNDSPYESGAWAVDMISDGKGGLLVSDTDGGAVRRISLLGCAPAPAPLISDVSVSARRSGLDLAAGQLFSIYGTRLGPPLPGATAQFDASGHVPLSLAGTEVTVNGIPAPILFTSNTQINAIVPFDLAGQQAARIVVTVSGVVSDVFEAQIGNFGPAIFSYSLDPMGYLQPFYAWMLNADGSINSASHPAEWGSAVAIFATGTGATNPAGVDGVQAGALLKRTVFPVSIVVDGQPANVLYAGSAPGEVEGVTQINLRLPDRPPSPLPAGVLAGSATIDIQMGVKLPAGPTLYFYVAH